MKSSKKSVAGRAALQSLLGGGSETANKDSNARIVEFYLPEMLLMYDNRTVLFGLRSGF
ncbi:MAG: hypothetical protein ICV84_03220 [Flavisolibacter sp.]|nr:hypothetical protein [Flavisolibacter sp.]